MQLAKKAGFEAIELAVAEEGELTLNSTKKNARSVLRMAQKVGIRLSSLITLLLWEHPLTSNDEKVRQRAKDIIKKMLELARHLEVDTILVVPGAVDICFKPGAEIVPYDITYERSLKALTECAQIAEKYKVSIGIENVWNKFLLSPLEMRDFIDKIGSEYVGSYFDVGNVLLTGYPEQWIRILDKRIKKIHIKDFKLSVGNINGFCNLLEGDVNWPEVVKALRDIGYNGPITAEVTPYKENPEALVYSTSTSMDFILGRR